MSQLKMKCGVWCLILLGMIDAGAVEARPVASNAEANQAPVVLLSRPFTGDWLLTAQATEVVGSVRDADGELGHVLLLLDGRPVLHRNLSGTNQAIIRWTWEAPEAGTHTLQLIALDDLGDLGESGELTVRVSVEPPVLSQVKLAAGAGSVFLRTPGGEWFGWGDNTGNKLNLDPSRLDRRAYEVFPQPVVSPPTGGAWRTLLPGNGHSLGWAGPGEFWLLGRGYSAYRQLSPSPFNVVTHGGAQLPAGVSEWREWSDWGLGGLADDQRIYRFNLHFNAGISPQVMIAALPLPDGAAGMLSLNELVDAEGVARDYPDGPIRDFGGVRAVQGGTGQIGDYQGRFTAFVLEDGSLWRRGGGAFFPDGPSGFVAPPDGSAGWRRLFLVWNTLIAQTLDGRLFGLGVNDRGQLGLGNRMVRHEFTEIPFPTGVRRWVQVVAGSDCMHALGDDGRLYGWGANDSGQLGLGHLASVDRPTPVDWLGDLRDTEISFPRLEQTNLWPFGTLKIVTSPFGFLPRDLELIVKAYDDDGKIVSVEFFRDGIGLGVVSQPDAAGNFVFPTRIETVGAWTFQAVLTDDQGGKGIAGNSYYPYHSGGTGQPWLIMSPRMLEARRGQPTTLQLNRTASTNLSLTVPLVIEGTAVPGVDYEPLPAEVHFDPGVAVVAIPIHPLITPGFDEPKTIHVRPASSGCAPGDASAGCYLATDASWGMVTILPPPRPVIAMEVLDNRAVEGEDDQGLFRFTRSVVTDRPVSVRYQFSGGVDPVTELVGFPATLEFAAGQTELLVPVVARFDFEVEPQDRFFLTLITGDCTESESDRACYELGYYAGTIYVVDSPWAMLPAVQLVVSDPLAIEGTTNTAIIMVTRTGDATHGLELDFELGGTALPGIDYALTPATIRLDPGQTTLEVVITALADEPLEEFEWLSLQLLSPACLGGTVNEGCYRLGETNLARIFVVDPGTFPPVPGSGEVVGALAAQPVQAMLFEAVEPGPDGGLTLRIVGDPGTRFELQASGHLADWSSRGVHHNETGRLSIVEPPEQAGRFYRLVPIP